MDDGYFVLSWKIFYKLGSKLYQPQQIHEVICLSVTKQIWKSQMQKILGSTQSFPELYGIAVSQNI